MAPRVVAKSGTTITLLNSAIRLAADADAEQSDADRHAHRQHRAERQDQHDDGEPEADELRLRRLERRQHLATHLHRQAVDGGELLGDLGADVGHRLLAHRLLEVHRRERDGAVLIDLLDTALVVRAGHGDALDGVDAGEQLGHRGLDLGVGHALLGVEHDRTRLARRLAREVLVEQVEAGRALRGRDLHLAGERRADDGVAERAQAEEDDDPGEQGGAAVHEAPASETSDHGGIRSNDVRGSASDATPRRLPSHGGAPENRTVCQGPRRGDGHAP